MIELRVAIADDSAIYRTIVQRCLAEIPGVKVVGTAADGALALELIEKEDPDLLLLDMSMPVMDGPATLAEMLRRKSRTKVILVSGVDPKVASRALDAVQHGAFEFVVKPRVRRGEDGVKALREPLKKALAAFRASLGRRAAPASLRAIKPTRGTERKPGSFDVVLIGISTGGPAALAELVPSISTGFPLPILVVQHMPAGFTGHLVQSLSRRAKIKVREGQNGGPVLPGQLVIAPGGMHMVVKGSRTRATLALDEGPMVNNCRPAVDRLFESAAGLWGRSALSVVMTGMGTDGLKGVRAVRGAGGYCLCQDEPSCAVYGMPKAVVDDGQADEILNLEGLAERIQRLAGKGNARWAS
jgi:two-component system, chemotaxis family, protein-glutamate methylesterase/glutaminase